MSFTDAGLGFIQHAMAPALRGGMLCVGNGTAPESYDTADLTGDLYAETPIASIEDQGMVESEGATKRRLLLSGTFAEDAANFDWSEKGVKLNDGTLVSRIVEDSGRKAPGTVWTCEIAVDLVP